MVTCPAYLSLQPRHNLVMANCSTLASGRSGNARQARSTILLISLLIQVFAIYLARCLIFSHLMFYQVFSTVPFRQIRFDLMIIQVRLAIQHIRLVICGFSSQAPPHHLSNFLVALLLSDHGLSRQRQCQPSIPFRFCRIWVNVMRRTIFYGSMGVAILVCISQ